MPEDLPKIVMPHRTTYRTQHQAVSTHHVWPGWLLFVVIAFLLGILVMTCCLPQHQPAQDAQETPVLPSYEEALRLHDICVRRHKEAVSRGFSEAAIMQAEQDLIQAKKVAAAARDRFRSSDTLPAASSPAL